MIEGLIIDLAILLGGVTIGAAVMTVYLTSYESKKKSDHNPWDPQ